MQNILVGTVRTVNHHRDRRREEVLKLLHAPSPLARTSGFRLPGTHNPTPTRSHSSFTTRQVRWYIRLIHIASSPAHPRIHETDSSFSWDREALGQRSPSPGCRFLTSGRTDAAQSGRAQTGMRSVGVTCNCTCAPHLNRACTSCTVEG